VTLFEIDIRNSSPKRLPLTQIRKRTAQILDHFKLKRAFISLLCVSERKMKRFNKQFFNRHETTDVIAMGQAASARRKVRKRIELTGDMILCPKQIQLQAKDWETSFDYELVFCICHGILHMLGHTDETAAKRAKMHRMQKQILKRIGIRNSLWQF